MPLHADGGRLFFFFLSSFLSRFLFLVVVVVVVHTSSYRSLSFKESTKQFWMTEAKKKKGRKNVLMTIV